MASTNAQCWRRKRGCLIAMGGGATSGRDNADVVLLGNDLQALPQGLALARHTLRIVKQNLVWAFAYNFLAIPLAMAGWVTPWMAGIGMSAGSSHWWFCALRLREVRWISCISWFTLLLFVFVIATPCSGGH
ncbi:MAG: hypothetical protein IPK39_21710 [Sulfuritalea sp.]|nr:hypothetical protein [Sulfuritalea sp.]